MDKARRSIYSQGPQIDNRPLERGQGTSAFSVEERLQLEALDTRPEHSVNPNAIGDLHFITLLVTATIAEVRRARLCLRLARCVLRRCSGET